MYRYHSPSFRIFISFTHSKMLSSFSFPPSNPVQRRYSSAWQTRFFGHQPNTHRMYTAGCICIYHQRACNTICENNGNPVVRRIVKWQCGLCSTLHFWQLSNFYLPPPTQNWNLRDVTRKTDVRALHFTSILLPPRLSIFLEYLIVYIYLLN